MSILKWTKITSSGFKPEKLYPLSAGYDLRSAYTYSIEAQGKARIKTDISIRVPGGTYGRIAPRSGLALKHVSVAAGVIDYDYTGNVEVVLFNHSKETIVIRYGDRIAQLICEKIEYPELEELESSEIDKEVQHRHRRLQRGESGFGSTGMQNFDKKNIQESAAESK